MASVSTLFSNRFSLLLITQLPVTAVLLSGHAGLPMPGEVVQAWLGILSSGTNLLAIGHSIGVWLLALLLAGSGALLAAVAGVLMNQQNKVPVLAGLLAWLLVSGGAMRLWAQTLQPHLSLLVLALAALAIPKVVALLETIPPDTIERCQTRRLASWRIAQKALLQDKAGDWLDLLRHNATLGWALLCLLEALTPERGGIATPLLKPDSHLPVSHFLAIQLTILAFACLQDYLLGRLKPLLLATLPAGGKSA